MSHPRAPRIAGVAGGVGTTTLATALRGFDRGGDVTCGVDVLVCRSTGQSLHQAATTVARLAADGRPRPVLVVTCDQPGPVRGTCRARLRMIEPQVAAVVVLPYVAHWRELSDPLAEAVHVAGQPLDRLPRTLRGYAESLTTLAALVVRSGLLSYPAAVTGPISPHPLAEAPPSAEALTPARPRAPTPAHPITKPSRPETPVPTAGYAGFLDVPLSRVIAYGGAR